MAVACCMPAGMSQALGWCARAWLVRCEQKPMTPPAVCSTGACTQRQLLYRLLSRARLPRHDSMPHGGITTHQPHQVPALVGDAAPHLAGIVPARVAAVGPEHQQQRQRKGREHFRLRAVPGQVGQAWRQHPRLQRLFIQAGCGGGGDAPGQGLGQVADDAGPAGGGGGAVCGWRGHVARA